MNGAKCVRKLCQKSVSVEVGQWMETPYMKDALAELTESEYLSQFDTVYELDNLWEDEKCIIMYEAVEYCHFLLRQPTMVNEIASYIKTSYWWHLYYC